MAKNRRKTFCFVPAAETVAVIAVQGCAVSSRANKPSWSSGLLKSDPSASQVSSFRSVVFSMLFPVCGHVDKAALLEN